MLCACGLADIGASCGGPGPPVSRDCSALNTATRIKVHIEGADPLAVVTNSEKIRVARDFIKQYENGWKSFRWQGSAPSQRRFDFLGWRPLLGRVRINPDTHNDRQLLSSGARRGDSEDRRVV
jgi:hypothetical protein